MMKMSLKRNLQIGFSIALLILIISSATSYRSINSLLKSAALVRHTNQVVNYTNNILSTMKDAETGQRGFLLTGQEDFLNPYNGTKDSINRMISEVKTLTADNPQQQQSIAKLEDLINIRFTKLEFLIAQRRQNNKVDIEDLRQGRVFMNSIRQQVQDMNGQLQTILEQRTDKLDQFSENTPLFIIASALVALIIVVLFYFKIKKDIDERIKLQEALEQKDRDINHRLEIIQHITEKISSGDYTTRVKDDSADTLGGISIALNKMTQSLETSFNTLEAQEWQQTGIAELNMAIAGDDNLQSLTQKMMQFIAEYTGSQVGAFYLYHAEKFLSLENGFALVKNSTPQKLAIGESLAGQAAQSRKAILVNNIRDEDIHISFASASLKPVNIIAFPVMNDGEVKAVIELGSLQTYSQRALHFFKVISENMGIAISTVQHRQKVQELLEETQSQSEELMSQQTELEQINAELEAQAQQLQTSEEELKVQSEELIETNTLLEERSSLLEQRNQLIQEKNTEIIKKAEDLALSTKYKSEFLANMSHELRTPLNSILLLSRLMSENNEQNLSPEQVQYAQVIQSSGNGLLQLID